MCIHTSNLIARQELDADIVEMGAGVIDPKWFITIPHIPNNLLLNPCRYWDLAVSIKTSADYSAGILGGLYNGKFTICHLVHDRFEYYDLKKRIISTAISDGTNTIIGLEEAGQQKGFISDLKHEPDLYPYPIKARQPQGDKLSRALPWITRAESGQIQICGPASWTKVLEDELRDFSPDMSHAHDDIVDAISGSYDIVMNTFSATGGKLRF